MSRASLFYLLPAMVILLPNVGLYLVAWTPGSHREFYDGGEHTMLPLLFYTIFAALFFATWAFFHVVERCYFPRRAVSRRNDVVVSEPVVKWLGAVGLLALVSQLDLGAILTGEIGKGEIRAGGQLIAIITKYLLPTLFAYACLTRRFVPLQMGKRTVVFVGAVTFVSAVMLGTKAGAIIALLPGVLALTWRGLPWRAVIALALGGFVALVVAGMIFDSFIRGDIVGAVQYVLQRAFIITAEVPYRITNRLLEGDIDFAYGKTLWSIVTNSLLVAIWGESDDLYRYTFSTAVSGELYPALIPQIIAGEWNHTPAVYVEGLLAFGLFYWVFAILAASIGWFLIKWIRKQVASGNYVFASLLLTYFVFVYVAWLNSAGITILIHPFVLISMFSTWALLRGLPKLIRVANDPFREPLYEIRVAKRGVGRPQQPRTT